MAGKQMDVVALGACAVDYYAVVPKLPREEEKTTAVEYKIAPGGVAGNVLTQTARLGLRSGWIGKIGDDESGSILLNEFRRDKVDSSHTEVVKGKHSMFTWIAVDPRGERSIIMFPNVLSEFTARDVIAKHAEYIRASRMLQIEACVLPLGIMLAGARIAKKAGVMVVFDLDVPPTEIERSNIGRGGELEELLSLTDVLIPCKRAARELISSDDYIENANALLKFGPGTVAVTLGSNGCVVLNGKEKHVVPPVRIDKAVDTTGAGDAFHGGMIFALLNGMSLRDAGRLANACGAMCCTRIGARSMGTLAELRPLIDTYGD